MPWNDKLIRKEGWDQKSMGPRVAQGPPPRRRENVCLLLAQQLMMPTSEWKAWYGDGGSDRLVIGTLRVVHAGLPEENNSSRSAKSALNARQ